MITILSMNNKCVIVMLNRIYHHNLNNNNNYKSMIREVQVWYKGPTEITTLIIDRTNDERMWIWWNINFQMMFTSYSSSEVHNLIHYPSIAMVKVDIITFLNNYKITIKQFFFILMNRKLKRRIGMINNAHIQTHRDTEKEKRWE